MERDREDPEVAGLSELSELLEEHGAKPTEAIMIGDSQNDVLTANNAGMYSIGVRYGLSPESLKIHPPDVLIDHPGELLEVLGL